MKYIKTFESHSIKKDIISKEKLQEILSKSNMVTLPYFADDEALTQHIETSFDSNDVAFVLNAPKELTSIDNNGDTAMLYTKNKTYVIEDLSEMEYNNICGDFEDHGGIE